MARHKNAEWNLPDPVQSWEQVNAALMMDIRYELRRLNRTMECANTQAIPGLLRDIERNTTKKRRRK
jgi:hypothetical protein